jgi:hypothetical protein
MCNVCVYVCVICIFYVFIKNPFLVVNSTRLKYTFGIKKFIGFRGTPLWSGVWLKYVINLVIVGALRYRFLW